MRVVIVGLGVQGEKRLKIAGAECVCTVDPHVMDADYQDIKDVPLAAYDAAIICTPDDAKFELIVYLLTAAKHVLVEKPLLFASEAEYRILQSLALNNRSALRTAYNHRFEPHFMAMKSLLEQRDLGAVYAIRLFYGNGTARLVQGSPWRDCGLGVLADLGSHLLDTLRFWLPGYDAGFKVVSANCFENRALDHCVISSQGKIDVLAEMTLLSWRNDFVADVFAEKGSVHIRSLCKWGPSTLIQRTRKYPSGRPDEANTVLIQEDPTWQQEYTHFKRCCEKPDNDLTTDRYIYQQMQSLSKQIDAMPTRRESWKAPSLDLLD